MIESAEEPSEEEVPYCAGLGFHSTGDHCSCNEMDRNEPCCYCGWRRGMVVE